MKMILILLFLFGIINIATSNIDVKISEPFSGNTFQNPVVIQNDGSSSRLYIVEQVGRIKVVDRNKPSAAPIVFLDIVAKVTSGGERGLLGLAFHPDYKTNRYFYVYYTNPDTVVARYTATSDTSADPNSEVILFTTAQPFANHNGGNILFGPDNYLYIGLGDGGSGGDPQNNGQTTNVFLGKLLRIDVDKKDTGKQYAVPSTNPFVGNAAFLPEIFAYGLRNPWRYSFDCATDKLWLADVGQDQWEEVDIVEKGKNYGWRVMEGRNCYNPATNCDQSGKELPIHVYSHTVGQSITGGFVYRGGKAEPIFGKYMFADFGSNKIWGLNPSDNSVEEVSNSGNYPAVSTFGVDTDQNLYFAAYNQGKIYMFDGNGNGPICTASGSVIGASLFALIMIIAMFF